MLENKVVENKVVEYKVRTCARMSLHPYSKTIEKKSVRFQHKPDEKITDDSLLIENEDGVLHRIHINWNTLLHDTQVKSLAESSDTDETIKIRDLYSLLLSKVIITCHCENSSTKGHDIGKKWFNPSNPTEKRLLKYKPTTRYALRPRKRVQAKK